MSPTPSTLRRALTLAAAVPFLAGCPQDRPQAVASPASSPEAGASPVQVAAATSALPAKGGATPANANELGLIPVMEYHRFGPKEERWTRTPANFRKDLEFFWANDYVLVNMRDVAKRKLDLPAGKKPLVFTFDDSTEGQFRYVRDANKQFKKDAAGKYVVDPDCAIAMLDAFAAKHPDFGTASTFYVLPSGFDQDGVIAEKFKYLVATGREIGNHTWTHDSMAPMSVAQINGQLGKLQAFVSKSLGQRYDIETLALPFGIGPKAKASQDAVVKGGTGEAAYHHLALLLVGANPAYSPYDKRYEPTGVPRIQAIDSEFRNWFNRKPGVTTKVAEPWAAYRSDGDPTKVSFPKGQEKRFDPAKLAPGQTGNPFDPKAMNDLASTGTAVVAASGSPVVASLAPVDAAASPTATQTGAPVAAASTTAGSPVPSATPTASGADTHPGYGVKLPKGGHYMADGKIRHQIQSGDNIEDMAWRYLKMTDFYTYPKLAQAIRDQNKVKHALVIGEWLDIPNVRATPPKAARVPRDKTFEGKGIYVTGTTAGSELLWTLIKDLKAHGGNMIVFDAKDMNGRISYKSAIPLAKSIGAFQGGMIDDMPKMLERLHAQGIHVAARMALFHDTKLCQAKPQFALRSKRTGAPWREFSNLSWVDASIPEVQDYNLAMAKEMIDAGVDEIQFDYVRFPAQGDTPDIAWKSMKTQKQKHEVITAWMKRAYEQIKPTGALLSADVYGVVAWDQGIDVRITGQKLEDLGPYLDVLSPMLYPSHFYGDFDNFSYPPDHPAYFIAEGVRRVNKRTAGSGVVVRPWLQAFPYRIHNYGPTYVQIQVEANRLGKGTGWLLWNAENSYKVGFAGVSQDTQAMKLGKTAITEKLPKHDEVMAKASVVPGAPASPPASVARP